MPGYRTTTAVPPPGLAARQLRAEPALRLLPRLVAFTLAAGDLAVNLGLLTRPFGPSRSTSASSRPMRSFVQLASAQLGVVEARRHLMGLDGRFPTVSRILTCRQSVVHRSSMSPSRERSPRVTSVLWLEREEFDRHVASGVDSAHECQRLAPKCLLDDRPELVLECV